jgi:hypothetical protein
MGRIVVSVSLVFSFMSRKHLLWTFRFGSAFSVCVFYPLSGHDLIAIRNVEYGNSPILCRMFCFFLSSLLSTSSGLFYGCF